jgi:tripeptidyl-peptidase-1
MINVLLKTIPLFSVCAAFSIPPSWNKRQVDAVEDIKLYLAIKHRPGSSSKLREFLYSVSLPTSPEYGKHATLDDLVEMMRPDEADIENVRAWAAEQELAISFNRYYDFATVFLPEAKAEDLFNCSIDSYEHANGRMFRTAIGGYTIPVEIASAVDFVSGLSEMFPRLRTTSTSSPLSERVQESFDNRASPPCLYNSATPQCLRDNYSITGSGKAANNSMAVVEFVDSYFDPADLLLFQTKYSLPKIPVANIIGLNNPASPQLEASLDVQAIMGIAQNVPLTVISIAKAEADPFMAWVLAQNDAATTPWVQSISWGTQEYDYFADGNMDRLNTELMKLGARGVTVLFATGDDGAGCYKSMYETNYPAVSPFVTAVGGVWIPPTSVTYAIEGDTISGGGFGREACNNRTVTPWQENAVQGYLNSSVCPSPTMFNPAGRGIPDVSAYDAYYPVFAHSRNRNL